MVAAGWLDWLERSLLAARVRESVWLYPSVETLHIIGFSILVGSAVMFDLRLLGVSPRVRVSDLAGHLLPWSRRSLLVVVPTGSLLFATQATAMAASPLFRLKLTLLACAGLNAWVFHRITFRSVAGWDQAAPAPIPAKLAAVSSLAIWAGVITCGRFLAYY